MESNSDFPETISSFLSYKYNWVEAAAIGNRDAACLQPHTIKHSGYCRWSNSSCIITSTKCPKESVTADSMLFYCLINTQTLKEICTGFITWGVWHHLAHMMQRSQTSCSSALISGWVTSWALHDQFITWNIMSRITLCANLELNNK